MSRFEDAFDDDYFIDGEEPIEDEGDLRPGTDVAGIPLVNSEIDLVALGLNDVAYVKAVLINGMPGFTIHAADGTPMAMTNDRKMAFAAVIQNDLDPVSVH
jgi:hypothetical protein